MDERLVLEPSGSGDEIPLELLPVAAVRIRPLEDARIEIANPAMAQLLGVESADELGDRLLRAFCVESAACKTLVDEAQRRGRVLGHEIVLRRADGQAVLCSVTAVTHAGPYETPVIDALIEPTDHRRTIFDPLLEASVHLRRAHEVAGLASWIVDHAEGRLHWSRGVYELFGLDPASVEPSFEALLEAVHPEDRETAHEQFSASLTQPPPFETVHRVRLRDGSVRYIKEYCHNEFDDRGQPLRSIGVVQDVTEHERTKHELEVERRRLENVIWATGVGTWEWNVQTGETRFNEAWAEIIGHTLDELEPVSIETWMNAAHPDDLEHSDVALREHFEGRAPMYRCRARMRHKSGRWIWVLDEGRVTEWDEHGRPLWMHGTHTEITDEYRLSRQRDELLRRLRKLTEQVPGVVYQFQRWPDGRAAMPYASAGLKRIYGIAPESVEHDASPIFARIHPEDLPGLQASIRQSFDELTLWHYQHRAILDDRTVWLEGIARPEPQSDGSVLWHGYIRDVTERRENELRLAEALNLFRHANEGIMLTDADGTIVEVNEAWCRITGYSADEAVGANPRILKSGSHDRAHYEKMFDELADKGVWTGETWNRNRDGELFAIKQTITTLHDEHGAIRQYMSLFTDITEVKESQRQLEQVSDFDLLTGLPNRARFVRLLAEAMNRVEAEEGEELAVVYIDLDGFKKINEHEGPGHGDRVLKAFAALISALLAPDDVLARLGGDEFVAMLYRSGSNRDLNDLVDGLLERARALEVGGRNQHLSASIGLTWYPQADAHSPDHLIRQADQAMYEAKQSGRNCLRVFDIEQHRRIDEVNTLVDEVRTGLSRHEFRLHYQPKVDMATGELVGAEALIRWQHPERGWLAPGQFLPEIEGGPVMLDIARWAINTAAAQYKRWLAEGRDIPVSVNVDSYTLLSPDFTELLRDCAEWHGLQGRNGLELEIVETSAIADHDRVREIIRLCASMGITFAIDDFGTGFSSLTYLKRLPAQCLKIDGQFVRGMLTDTDDLAILEGVLGLAESFRRKVVAEGVETVGHGVLLLAFDCRIAQGFAIARPMPGDELIDWAARWQPFEEWRHTQPQSRDALAAVYAYVAHNQWLDELTRFIEAERSEAPPMSETECAFGHWLDEAESRDHIDPAVLARLRDKHRQLHQRGRHALDKHGRGASPHEACERLSKAHADLVAELASLTGTQLLPLTDPFQH